MFNLLPHEMCQVCFHVHTAPDWCSADDYAPNPDGGDDWLGPCTCRENVTHEVASRMYLAPCDRPECEHPNTHMHTKVLDATV